jgi:hypothetical protein
MPYTNPEHKKQWESLHRAQRLARRRELRRIAAARKVDQTELSRVEGSAVGFLWLPIAGGVAGIRIGMKTNRNRIQVSGSGVMARPTVYSAPKQQLAFDTRKMNRLQK